VARAHGLEPGLDRALSQIQNELFHVGSDLCFPESDKAKRPVPRIEARHVEALETSIDAMVGELGPLANFILPGGSVGAAQLHLARTVCRRAERIVVSLMRKEPVGPHVLAYLNRLSDALFVMARWENRHRGIGDPVWDTKA
jgi:cob(I)alamin adenosyltransferase